MNGSELDRRPDGSVANRSAEGMLPIVVLEGVTKQFQEGERQRVILKEVDASIAACELVVVVGRSGSGKSTLLNLLSGIDLPTRGMVTVDDVEITALSEEERTRFRRDRIGFVFQSFNLIPTLTVLENILLPMELRGARDDRLACGLLDEVDLLDRAASFPDRLSGGERQRIAIARALAHEPTLVLADEPTGNLDADTGFLVLDLLEGLVRDRGKSMIVATHDRDLLQRADRVLSLSGGTLQAA